jgi:hypothetical protein
VWTKDFKSSPPEEDRGGLRESTMISCGWGSVWERDTSCQWDLIWHGQPVDVRSTGGVDERKTTSLTYQWQVQSGKHLSGLVWESVRSRSCQPDVPWRREDVETVPWLPWIWRRDRVSLFFRWKTGWWSQDFEKNHGQDPGKHIEGINQYQITDLWRQKSLHLDSWWCHLQETKVSYGGRSLVGGRVWRLSGTSGLSVN